MIRVKYIYLLLAVVLAASQAVSAQKGWVQSYKSGYKDKNGNFCGGSEIMHIVAHKGKLFAFNGYWKDRNFGKHSSQVLRLNAPDEKWVIDLETSAKGLNYKAGPIKHMKGNILKSINFTTDKNGKKINETVLVAASMAYDCDKKRTQGLSVFQRDDKTGRWEHLILTSGPLHVKQKDGSTKRVRRVPRDMEKYHDPVTGVDMLFLLGGDIGVFSGTYNSDTRKIEWLAKPEFPKNGNMLEVRPLGMTAANGKLYFSTGGQLYERINGRHPDWRTAFQMGGRIDVELGGMRGLSTMKNPTGPGESLIFLWIPRGRTRGDIKRLDGQALKEVHETDLRRYANEYFAKDEMRALSILGGYNRFLPVKDPKTGQIVHLVGFQQVVNAKDEKLKHYKYYKGAPYCIRWNDKKYTVHCVNGKWSEGKPILVAPRAYAQSPFPSEKDVIYFGGYDSNFEEATDMAWIFKADLKTVLYGK